MESSLNNLAQPYEARHGGMPVRFRARQVTAGGVVTRASE